MSKKSLTELLSADDDALPLIHEAVRKSHINITAFAESGENDGDDEDQDDDEQRQVVASPGVGPASFLHLRHRLFPINRGVNDEDDGGDSRERGSQERDDGKSTAVAAAAAALPDPGVAQLLALQVTTRSYLGSVAFHFHAIHAYAGLIKVLGAGRFKAAGEAPAVVMHSISSLTAALKSVLPADCRAVAFDVFGGVFALNSGSIRGSRPGNVVYFAYDSVAAEPEDLDVTYTAWLSEWLMNPSRVYLWYSKHLFSGWDRALQTELGPNDAWSFMPPLWSAEAKTADVGQLSRASVPITEAVLLRAHIGAAVSGAAAQVDAKDGEDKN